MKTELIMRAGQLLNEALELLDQAQAPPDLGARLQELILRLRDLGL